MVRKNIFEILENKWDSIAEIIRIYKLLYKKSISNPYNRDMTPIAVVNETYQMLLLAFLLNEQPSRSKKICQLKEKIR